MPGWLIFLKVFFRFFVIFFWRFLEFCWMNLSQGGRSGREAETQAPFCIKAPLKKKHQVVE